MRLEKFNVNVNGDEEAMDLLMSKGLSACEAEMIVEDIKDLLIEATVDDAECLIDRNDYDRFNDGYGVGFDADIVSYDGEVEAWFKSHVNDMGCGDIEMISEDMLSDKVVSLLQQIKFDNDDEIYIEVEAELNENGEADMFDNQMAKAKEKIDDFVESYDDKKKFMDYCGEDPTEIYRDVSGMTPKDVAKVYGEVLLKVFDPEDITKDEFLCNEGLIEVYKEKDLIKGSLWSKFEKALDAHLVPTNEALCKMSMQKLINKVGCDKKFHYGHKYNITSWAMAALWYGYILKCGMRDRRFYMIYDAESFFKCDEEFQQSYYVWFEGWLNDVAKKEYDLHAED